MQLILCHHDAHGSAEYTVRVPDESSLWKKEIFLPFFSFLDGDLDRNSNSIDFSWEESDREIFHESTIDEVHVFVFIWCENARNTDRCSYGIDDFSFFKNDFFSSIDIGCEDFEWNKRIFEFFFSEILLKECGNFLPFENPMYKIKVDELPDFELSSNLPHFMCRVSTRIKSRNNPSNTRP